MILPTKHISVENSLLGVGALLIQNIDRPLTVSALWEKVRSRSEVSTYERFTLALNLLYMVGAIELAQDKVRRIRR